MNADGRDCDGGWIALVDELEVVGFDADETFLLVVSRSGRGVFELATGRRVVQDVDVPSPGAPWMQRRALLVLGCGPLAAVQIPVVGRWGGALATSSGGARVERARDDGLRVHLPGGGCWELGRQTAALRAVGFSPSGRWLVVATAAELTCRELAVMAGMPVPLFYRRAGSAPHRRRT